jgi:hypothetical protein
MDRDSDASVMTTSPAQQDLVVIPHRGRCALIFGVARMKDEIRRMVVGLKKEDLGVSASLREPHA